MIRLRIHDTAPGVWRLTWTSGPDDSPGDLLVVDAQLAAARWQAVADIVFNNDRASRTGPRPPG